MDNREKTIFFISLLIKFAFVAIILLRFGLNIDFTDSDIVRYFPAAQNMLERGVYSIQTAGPYNPSMFYPPVYSILIAGLYAILGKFWVVGIYFLQAVIMAWAGLYFYSNLKDKISEKAAFKIALLFSLEPFSNFFVGVATPNPIFTAMIVVGVMSFWSFLIKSKQKDLIISAIFIGLASLTKPIAEFLPVLLIVVLIAYYSKNKISMKLAVKNSFYYALLFFIVISPWLLRNVITFRTLSISSLPTYNLYFYNAVALVAKEKQIGTSEAQELLLEKAREETGATKQDDFFDPKFGGYLKKSALSIINADKINYLKVHLLTIPAFLMNDSYGKIYSVFGFRLHNSESVTLLLSNGQIGKAFSYLFGRDFLNLVLFNIGKLLWLLVYIFIAINFYKIVKSRNSERVFNFLFLGVIVLYFALSTGPVASAAYRLPVQAFIFSLIFI